jgi:hypothetical protein
MKCLLRTLDRCKVPSVAGLLALCALVPSAEAAGSAKPCAVRDANVFIHAPTGIAFAKTKRVEGRAVRRVYACLFSTDKIVPLGSRRESGSVQTGPRAPLRLVGRYVAYVQVFGERTTTGAVGVNVVDLKRGLRVAGFEYPVAGSWDVEALVLKKSGGVAWAGNEPVPGSPQNRANKIDGPQPVGLPANENKVLLDDAVDPGSLGLSSDRTEVSWLHFTGTEQRTMSAPLG